MKTWNWKFPDYSDKWTEISEACKKRDKHTCRKCGAKGFKAGGSATLQAAHIKSRRLGGVDVLTNLITLCVKCHAKEEGHSHMKANSTFKKQIKKQGKKWTF